jgi:hypothetical protein
MNVGGAEALLLLFFLLVGIGGMVLWIWALVDAIRVPDDSMYRAGNKLVWVLVIVFAQFVGAIIYLLVGRPAGSVRGRSGSRVPPPPPPR